MSERLDGCLVIQGLLRQVLVVQPDIAMQRLLKIVGAVEVGERSTCDSRPLKRSTMPLVCGDFGLVSRCSMPRAWHSASNSCRPDSSLACLPNSRSVNSLSFSVNKVLTFIGAALATALRNERAAAAVLWLLMAMNTQRVARSMATNT